MLQAPGAQQAIAPVQPNLNPQQAAQSQQPITELKYDYVGKLKSLIWTLKETLANIMKVAGANIYHNATVDNSLKASDDSPPRIDKALEEFFSLCNQIELNLKTIQECALQQKDSLQYLPLHVSPSKVEGPSGAPQQDTNLSYSQYLSTLKSQVSFAKSVQEILNEGARKITQVE